MLLEPLEDRSLLSVSPLEIVGVQIGEWGRIETPMIDERSIEVVPGENLLFYHGAAQPATPEFGTASHMWRQDAPSGPFGDKTAVEVKWWDAPSTDETYHNGKAVTVASQDFPDISGQAYLKYVGYQRFQLWKSYDGSTFSNPVTTIAMGDANGYLGEKKFTLYDGHVVVNPGTDDAVGRVTFAWDESVMTLGTATTPTGLQYSYNETVLVPGATVYSPQHTWGPGSTYGSGNPTATVRIKGATDVADGTQGTIYGSQWASMNGIDVYMQREYAGWYYLWQDASYTVPVVPTDMNDLKYLVGSNGANLVDGVTQTTVTETGDVFRDPIILNNGGGNLEAYFSPAGEDASATATGLIRATSNDNGLTWAVDPILGTDVLNGTVSLGSESTPAAFGSFSHMWAQGGGGTGNDGQAITFKWYNEGGGVSGAQYNGRAVTLLGSTVTDVNGQGYLKYTGYPEYYQLWRSFDGTNFSDPVTTTASGYLGEGNGFIADGHVSQTFPGNGAVSVTEVGTQRLLFAADKYGDINLFTSPAGANGPFSQQGIFIANGVTGSPASTITSAARSGVALPVTLPGSTNQVLTMYVDGNFNGAADNEANQGAIGFFAVDSFFDVMYQVDDVVRIDDPLGGGSKAANGVLITFANSVKDAGMTALEEATLANVEFVSNQMNALLLVIGAVDDPGTWTVFNGQPDPR
jgi:hypothetical protein